MLERFVSNELEGMWMGAVMAELGYYNIISLERLRKTKETPVTSHYAMIIIRTNTVGQLKKYN
jgi:hypothetical protein